MPDPFSANEPALGYLYQVRYALYLLLQEARDYPEHEIAIERLDDVSFEAQGTPLQLIQLKHVKLKEASLRDSSKDLWKTLRIWSGKIREDRTIVSRLILSLVTTGLATDKSVAAKLRQDSARDEAGALQLLRGVATTSISKANKNAYEDFMALNESDQQLLISRIRVIDDNPDIAEVKTKMLNIIRLFSPHSVSLLERLEGWWFERAVGNLINNSQLNTISGNELLTRIYDLVSQLQDDNLPIDFPMLTDMDESDLSEKQRVFVEQLKLVFVSQPRLRMAIGHYYRAYQQRSKWLREGLIFPRELADYEEYLEIEWRTQFEIMRENLSEIPGEEELRDLGRKLFNWADTTSMRPIRQRFLDASFSRGSYHMLANEMRIGWHANFRDRLAHLMVEAARSVS